MSESSQALRTFTGKAALARLVHQPQHRAFLYRNLREALDAHERVGDGGPWPDGMLANARRAAQWPIDAMPEILDGTPGGHKPVLAIESLQIRPPSDTSRTGVVADASQRQPSLNDGLPAWLPPPDQQHLALTCQVHAKILDPSSPVDQIHLEVKSARIVQRHCSDGRLLLDVVLDSPFQIELDRLLVASQSRAPAGRLRQWQWTAPKRYRLALSLQCRDPDDSASLLAALEGRPRAHYAGASPRESVLHASWEGLPDCPPPGRLLSLRRWEGGSFTTLSHVATVAIGWTQPETALVRHNRAQAGEIRQLPTPAAEKSAWSVKYKFRDGFQVREDTRHSLECIYCNNGYEHSSFLRLYLHYTNTHQAWDYKAEGDHWMDSAGMAVTVWISDPENPSAAEVALRDKNISWIAPRAPLDIIDYLRGEGPWASHGGSKMRSPQKKLGRGIARPVTASSAAASEKNAQEAIVPRSKRRRRDPEQVPDLPSPNHRRYRVPNVPGVTFFRTTSKRALQTGEELSESDEEIDTRWLTQRQRRDLRALGAPPSVVQFHEMLHVHLDAERPTSDMMIEEAMIRFARRYAERWKKDPVWADLLREQLVLMEQGRVITKAAFEYCLSFTAPGRADSAQPAQDYRSPSRRSVRPDRPRETHDKEAVVIPESPRSEASDGEDADRPRKRWIPGRRSIVTSVEQDAIPTPTGSDDDDHTHPALLERTFTLSRPGADKTVDVRATAFLPPHLVRPDPPYQTAFYCPPRTTRPVQVADFDFTRLQLSLAGLSPPYDAASDTIVCQREGQPHVFDQADDFTRFLSLLSRESEHSSPVKIEVLTPAQCNALFDSRAAQRASSATANPGHGGGKIARAIRANQTSSSAHSLDRSYTAKGERCLCGERAEGMRGTIVCGATHCSRTFHTRCLGLERRSVDWRCRACVVEGAAEAKTREDLA